MPERMPPHPGEFRDLKTWAEQLHSYMVSTTRIAERNDPLATLLPHRMGGTTERAASANGMLMYDPAEEGPVVSRNGVWEHDVVSADVTRIVFLADEAAYNALYPKDTKTLYIWP